jgi:cytochrome c oxidase subunit I
MSEIALPHDVAYAHSEPRGLATWLTATDHKRIGMLYIMASLVFFVIGAAIAITMRTQTMQPGMKVLSAEQYNQAFSLHGTTMIFLFAMPILIGFANYLVPLMIGARDMAFPRLNALSFWLFLFGGLTLYSGLLFGGVLDTGWFSYAPLTEKAFSPHDGVSVWIIALTLLGISSVAGAINFIMTMLRLRAPGMRWRDMPMFCIATFINSFLILFAFPSLTAALGLLYLDRFYHTGWYNPARGGDPIIWQHLFWFFGHPEVYILILPAFGMMSEIVPVFARKPLFGRLAMILSLVAIGFLGFLVWAHHMFTAGLPSYFNAIMAGTSMLIAIPTGVKIFNWLATMWGGSLRLKTPLLFASGLIALFTVGGISGVLQASVPFDWQVNDSFFIVAHLHNVLFSGTAFAAFAGFYYWFPKMSGRMLSDRLGKVHFWTITVGFLLTFMPMYGLGLLGMPRRLYTYSPNLGWSTLDFISAIGAYIIGAAIVIFFVNIVRSLLVGEPAGDDPWDAWTLEWATSSPPPTGNFAALPWVASERPLWDAKRARQAAGAQPEPGASAGLDASQKAQLVAAARPAGAQTAGASSAAELLAEPPAGRSAAAAEAAALHALPAHPDHWTSLPVITALVVVVIGVGLLTTLLVVAVGVALLLIMTALWMGADWQTPEPPVMPGQRFTALGSGVLMLIGSEIVLFGALVSADLHLRIHDSLITLGGAHHLPLTLPIINTVILMTSGITAHYALTGYRKGSTAWFRFFLVMTVILGAVFLGGQGWEYTHAGFGLSSGLTGSSFFTLTGLHGAHVMVGILLLVYLLFRSARDRRRQAARPAAAEPSGTAAVVARASGTAGMAEAATYYWHFVDAVWVVIFVVVYLL